MNARFFRSGLAVVVVALGGCALGPDYEPPQVPVPDAYRETVPAGQSIAELSWWTLFDDQNMLTLIETALINNKDMAIAAARLEEARASLGFVRAGQYPAIGASAQAERGTFVQGVPGNINEQFVLAANLSFEIDLWGKLRRATESARAQLLATAEARNVLTSALIADVASSYLLLLDLDRRVEVAKRTRQTRQESLSIIQARYDKGTVALIDVNQAEIELGDAIAQLASLRRERAQSENLLSVLVGQNPGVIRRSLTSEKAMVSMPQIPAGLPSELLLRRPDVRQASQALAAQTARIGVAKALRFPSLSLTGLLGLASTELDDFFSSDSEAWSVGAGLLGPVYDAGRSRSRVEVEQARTRQLVIAYELTVLQAMSDVENALVAIETYRDEALAREAQVVAARSGSSLSRARYNGGVTSFLEVLESDRSLFRAELLASSVRREQLVSIVLLYKALGGGWPTHEEIEEAGSFENAVLREQSRQQ